MSDDLISRQAAIDALAIGEELLNRILDDMDVVGNDREKYEWGLGLIQSYIADMKELPTAQPERKKGKWVREKCRGLMYKCSACGNYLDFRGVNAGRGNANFCPNCGAEMEE